MATTSGGAAGATPSGCCGLFALNDYRKKAGLSFSFLVFAALNITMVYNGANNLKKCPGEPMVPVYLLVAGSTSLALLVVRLIVSHVLMPQLVNHHADISAKPGSPEDFPLVRFLVHGLKVFDTLASIFSTCWLIAGSAYVYGAEIVYESESEVFCNKSTYIFAYVVITIGYVSLVLSLIAAICTCLCSKSSEEDDDC